ncbi:MAG: metal ABC transporter substrate-binding protein, partial [Anaerolineales bacterium]
MKKLLTVCILSILVLLAACKASSSPAPGANELKVLAVSSFLTDMAQHVAGDRLEVETLIPVGVDPHTFEPTPQDVTKIADSQVVIANGAGLEVWLQEII